MERFLSRKFLLTLLVIAGGLAIALGGDSEEMANLAEKIGGMAAAIVAIWRYVKTEGEIDAAALEYEMDHIVKEVQDEEA